MNRYKVTKQLGDGTYGQVLKAVNRQTGEVVKPTQLLSQTHKLSLRFITGCHQEDEEEVLFLGRMYAAARNQGWIS